MLPGVLYHLHEAQVSSNLLFFVCILEYPCDSFRSIGGSECFLPFARTMPITCPVFRRELQAIEKVDGMMIGEKTVQAGDAFLQHLEMTIQMISKKYRRI